MIPPIKNKKVFAWGLTLTTVALWLGAYVLSSMPADAWYVFPVFVTISLLEFLGIYVTLHAVN
jgi:hypothetical protein